LAENYDVFLNARLFNASRSEIV